MKRSILLLPVLLLSMLVFLSCETKKERKNEKKETAAADTGNAYTVSTVKGSEGAPSSGEAAKTDGSEAPASGATPSSGTTPAAGQKIVFIRHGEKPDNGDNLSCQGFNRSLQLPAVLKKKFGTFDNVLVPSLKEGKATKQSRMFQTVSPYVIKEGININTKFDEADAKGVADAIKSYQGNTLLVWEHKNIEKILKELGLDYKWDKDDFDTILIITFQNGQAVMTKDKEGINPGANCN